MTPRLARICIVGVVFEGAEPAEARQIEAAEEHTGGQFSENGWLTDPSGESACQFRRREDDSQSKDDRDDWIGVQGRRIRPVRQDRRKSDDDRESNSGWSGQRGSVMRVDEDGGPTIPIPAATAAAPLGNRGSV